MEKTIIVTTDFSDSAANALDFACRFAMDYHFKILLAHIHTIPVGYTAEGPSLATINDILTDSRKMLREKLEQMKNKFPKICITAEMIVGNFLKSLGQLKNELDPELIITGIEGEHSELWPWRDNWLKALKTVTCPVLVIPRDFIYRSIRNIAFASDNKKECLSEQIDTINKFVSLSAASFNIVHVTPEIIQPEEDKNAAALKKIFSNLNPQYYTIENKLVVKGIAEFIDHQKIDLLITVPHKHGLWYNLFKRGHTMQFALLNYIPVMAIHENN